MQAVDAAVEQDLEIVQNLQGVHPTDHRQVEQSVVGHGVRRLQHAAAVVFADTDRGTVYQVVNH